MDENEPLVEYLVVCQLSPCPEYGLSKILMMPASAGVICGVCAKSVEDTQPKPEDWEPPVIEPVDPIIPFAPDGMSEQLALA